MTGETFADRITALLREYTQDAEVLQYFCDGDAAPGIWGFKIKGENFSLTMNKTE